MNPIKLLLLCLFAPRFLKDLPPRGPGTFTAGAVKFSRFYAHPAVTQLVKGRRRAYFTARWIALNLGWARVSNEVGVRWFVVRGTPLIIRPDGIGKEKETPSL